MAFGRSRRLWMDWDDDDLEDGYWDPDDYPFRRGEPLNDEGFMDEDLEDDGRDDYNDRQLDLLEGCCEDHDPEDIEDEAEECYDDWDPDPLEMEDPRSYERSDDSPDAFGLPV